MARPEKQSQDDWLEYDALPPDLTGGKLYAYATCPLCGWNRPVDSKKRGRFAWRVMPLNRLHFIQFRQQHSKEKVDGVRRGRCKGFTAVPGGKKSIRQILGHPRYESYVDVVTTMAERTVFLVRQLIHIGVLDRDAVVEGVNTPIEATELRWIA
tara:strand:+ start:2931 stop:3392 length:462 start_codon:yes stop_codon:yes gene_type:complete